MAIIDRKEARSKFIDLNTSMRCISPCYWHTIIKAKLYKKIYNNTKKLHVVKTQICNMEHVGEMHTTSEVIPE